MEFALLRGAMSGTVSSSVRRVPTVPLLLAIGAGAALAVRAIVRRSRRMEFRGRVVVITGGSRGLGLELARVFAAEGARLVLCARDAAELARARAALASWGAEVHVVVSDVTVAGEAEEAMRAIEATVGPIDVLVNDAGIITVGPHEQMTVADYDAAMRTHFWGPLATMHAVLPGMRARRSGRIVNIASIGGKLSVPHMLPYSASKFALVGLSEGLRAEVARDGVYVTTVAPGLMRTGSPRNVTVKGDHEAEYAWFAIGDALPGFSVDAARAARAIVNACRDGTAEVVVGLPARIAALVHGVAPGLTAEMLSIVSRFLPANPPGIRPGRRGAESGSVLVPSVVTRLSDRAALRNNEIG